MYISHMYLLVVIQMYVLVVVASTIKLGRRLVPHVDKAPLPLRI